VNVTKEELDVLIDDLIEYAISHEGYPIPESKKALKKARRALIKAVLTAESEYEAGYRAAQMDAFSEASMQVFREWKASGMVAQGPDTGAAYVMNWLNRAMSKPVPPRKESE
jgi:hypothetical protein